jgi:hypothetical protein
MGKGAGDQMITKSQSARLKDIAKEIAVLKARSQAIDEEDARQATLEYYRLMSTREGRRHYDMGPFAVIEDWFRKLFGRK